MYYFRWPLFAGASTTTVCQELLEAIAALRQSRRSHAHCKLASPSNMIRIEGLLHFAAEVNCGAGLGFIVQNEMCGRHLVTSGLVRRLCVGLAALIATVYVVLHVVLTMHV